MLETAPSILSNLLNGDTLWAIPHPRLATISMPLCGTLPKTVNARCQQLTVVTIVKTSGKRRRPYACRVLPCSDELLNEIQAGGIGFGIDAVLL